MKPPNYLAQKLDQYASTECLELLKMGGTEVSDRNYKKTSNKLGRQIYDAFLGMDSGLNQI
jgi:hypothetical protein